MATTLKRVCVAVALLGVVGSAARANAETFVTTYVTKVQEERQSTRWTLTEWLRIKERMRMMDLWLAMFSDPKKDQFRPELNLSYGVTRGQVTFTDDLGVSEAGAAAGTQGRAQLWLTNLVSGTVGIRMLNIDLGGEIAERRFGGDMTTATPAAAAAVATAPADESVRASRHRYYTGNLRLFGKSIQDSSLIFKYGEYQSDNTLPRWTDAEEQSFRRGKVAGGELSVYLTKWLGAEGNYLAYGDRASAYAAADVGGTYYDYMGFIEVSLLRLMVGRYQEDWRFASADGDGETTTTESGLTFGAKLSF